MRKLNSSGNVSFKVSAETATKREDKIAMRLMDLQYKKYLSSRR